MQEKKKREKNTRRLCMAAMCAGCVFGDCCQRATTYEWASAEVVRLGIV
jgi:hypothetical protein